MAHKGELKEGVTTTALVMWPKRHRAAIIGAETACWLFLDAVGGNSEALAGFAGEQDLRSYLSDAASKDLFQDWPGPDAFGHLLSALVGTKSAPSAEDFSEFLHQIRFGEQALPASTESLLVQVLSAREYPRACLRGHEDTRVCTSRGKRALLIGTPGAGPLPLRAWDRRRAFLP